MTDPRYTPSPPGTDGYETFSIQKEGDIDWLTLDRPSVLNALSRQMMLELQHYFGELYSDSQVRVVILRGEGKSFCAGLDLKEERDPSERGPSAGMRAQRRVSEIMMRMRRCPQPIISLIHGAASGGGFALALASDVRLATPDARMNAAFIRIGLTACDVGVSYFLPRLAGTSLASELLLTGRFLGAERAHALGLVSELVPHAELNDAGRRLARDMLRNSPLGLRLTKECLNHSLDAGSLEAVVAMEDRQQILCAQTDDMREGVRAFFERRNPEYTDS